MCVPNLSFDWWLLETTEKNLMGGFGGYNFSFLVPHFKITLSAF
jgi:hypothetical protein